MGIQAVRPSRVSVSARRHVALAAACATLACAVAVTAAIGVFGRGDGGSVETVSIRGERYAYVTDGIYKYNPERVVAEGVGWDLLTLCVAAPMLLVLTPWVARGSLRARMLAMGLLAYFFYQYLMYSVYWAFGPLFPVFVILYPVSFALLVWVATTVDLQGLPGLFDGRFPRKGMIVLDASIAVMLLLMWSPRISKGLAGDLSAAGLLGTTTLAVQALDLGMIVPLAILTAVLLWRRSPAGFLFGPVLAIKGATMALAICAMLLSAWRTEGVVEVLPLAMFGLVAVVCIALFNRALASLRG